LAFERRITGKKEIQLVSCMDMIFNLLLFFLVTSNIATNAKLEKRFVFPTPKYDLGSAEIFIQWIDDKSVFWVDQAASSQVQRVLDQYSYMTPEEQNRETVALLKIQNQLNTDQFDRKLQAVIETADANPGKKYFALLRCPNEVPYDRVIDAVARLSGAKYGNVEYGCVGGSLSEMRMSVLERTDEDGNIRRLIRIDFEGAGT
jgi:biopolymer transport protein ExbD